MSDVDNDVTGSGGGSGRRGGANSVGAMCDDSVRMYKTHNGFKRNSHTARQQQ